CALPLSYARAPIRRSGATPEGGVDRAFPASWQGLAPLSRAPKAAQILAVFAVADRLDEFREPCIIDISLSPGDFFGAADLQTLAILHRLDELRGAQQARRRAGIEPSIAAAELLDREPSLLQVLGIDVADLELAARRARQAPGDVAGVGIVEI